MGSPVTNSEVITKEWNGFGFRLITTSDYPAVLQHLQENFYRDEPMQQILGLTEDFSADMDEKYLRILDQDIGNFYAYPLDHPEKIAGVLIIYLEVKGSDTLHIQPRSPMTNTATKFVDQLTSKYNIHDRRDVSSYPEIFTISIDRQYRGKGLATEMYRRAIDKLKSQEFKFVSSIFTNPLSRLIGDKFGFKEVNRLNFSDYKNEDGSFGFGEAGKGHFAIESVLDL